MDCIFCKIVQNEIPSYKIYDDDDIIVFLDINPNANGHCLIVPKKHFDNLIDIDTKTLTKINDVSKYLYNLYKAKLNIDGLTLVQNNEYGQDVKHYHMHLVPRYENDNYHANVEKDKLNDIKDIYEKITN